METTYIYLKQYFNHSKEYLSFSFQTYSSTIKMAIVYNYFHFGLFFVLKNIELLLLNNTTFTKSF